MPIITVGHYNHSFLLLRFRFPLTFALLDSWAV